MPLRHIASTLLIIAVCVSAQHNVAQERVANDNATVRQIAPDILDPLVASQIIATPHDSREFAERQPEAVMLYSCEFDNSSDANFDNWPDHWIREHSVAYPHYLPIRLVDEASPIGKRCLRVDLDGGAAAVHSPPVNVDAMYTYVVEGYVRCEGLKHDQAWLSVTFLDENNRVLETAASERLGKSSPWTKLRIGPIAVRSAKVHHAVISLHVAPTDKADLRGTALFGDVWMGRLPRMTLSADRNTHIFTRGEKPKIDCTVSGFAEDSTLVAFELIDVAGHVLARSEQKLTPLASPRKSKAQSGNDDGTKIFAGSTQWQPPISQVGFYRVRVELPGKSDVANQREISLAVIDSAPPPIGGEFGWSLPDGEKPLSLIELAEVLGQAGINWCKFPLWDESVPADREEQLISFAERLGLRKIELIGLLFAPPKKLRDQLAGAESRQAAGIFSAPAEMWYPSLEPIMTRLSLKVRWWQLGLDRDQSFVNYPDLPKKVSQLKKQFSRYGQRVQIGLGWSWLKEMPGAKPTWDFLSLSAEPALTWEEQLTYLKATKGCGCRRFVVLDPLPKNDYSIETRASDLVMRMLAAKMEGAEGVFVPEAFNDNRGLMNVDGTVGELFIPWRTTALAFAGAKPLGSLQLPGNLSNLVFARGEEILMVLWGDRDGEARLYLGEDVEQLDLWGRVSKIQLEGGQQVIPFSRMPIILRNVSSAVARTQMSVQFEQTRLPSLFGRPQPNAILFKNGYGQSIRGTVKLVTPDVWRVSPKDINFKVSSNETMYQQIEITLPINAGTGRQMVRMDFDLTADRRYQFSVYRQIEVGLSDIFAEAMTRINEKGELEVEQRLTNETDEIVSFKCYLYAPARKRMMQLVEDHGRGVDAKIFRIANGEELLGEPLYLRAEEINGARILNYRVVVQR